MKLSLNHPAPGTSEVGRILDVTRFNPDLSSSKKTDRQGISDMGQQLVLLVVGVGFMGGMAILMGYLVSAA
jgi:hypothetical protein